MIERRVFRASLLVGLPGFAIGCTFLIDFDEVPPGDRTDSSSGSVMDAAIDGTTADGQARDAGSSDAACKGKEDGHYCPGNQIAWPGDKDDLVQCKGGSVASVRHCSGGTGCIRMRDGYPDQCDECPKKSDGVYCGRDMPGWETKNQSQRVRCQNGFEIELQLCSAGCTSNGASSSCK